MSIGNPSASFTRPSNTTAYASGDLVANSTTTASVVPLSWVLPEVINGSIAVPRIRMTTSSTSVTMHSLEYIFIQLLPFLPMVMVGLG